MWRIDQHGRNLKKTRKKTLLMEPNLKKVSDLKFIFYKKSRILSR